ncbi:hypothetical protein PpBr36_08067 [Pyricularia pennisetigena]|uniref:hypothetical protein n=1 Tax=Pyricularia pennisetigena TaxID=1578925 RepID=UPI001153D7F9|nr:hypothetical protein PpBr36_08067 [Pyricularia pennisetigena]TLS24178.1 hypothetical protein PpBr36_08067 [Pyricularia pennisetigena]
MQRYHNLSYEDNWPHDDILNTDVIASDDDNWQAALSPSDGYFGGTAWLSGGAGDAETASRALLPDVWVLDPSLQRTHGDYSYHWQGSAAEAVDRGRGSAQSDSGRGLTRGWSGLLPRAPSLPHAASNPSRICGGNGSVSTAAAVVYGSIITECSDRRRDGNVEIHNFAPGSGFERNETAAVAAGCGIGLTAITAGGGHQDLVHQPVPKKTTTTTTTTTEEETPPPAYSTRSEYNYAYHHHQLRNLRNYNTFAMRDGAGRDSEDEASGLLSSPQPRGSASGERQGLLTESPTTTRSTQSMGRDVDVDDVEPARWRPAKRRTPLLRSRAFRMLLIAIAAAAIVLGFLAAYSNSGSARTTNIIESSGRPLKSQASLGDPEPGDSPIQVQSTPIQVQSQQEPPMQYPPFDGEITFPAKSGCATGKLVNKETYPFITGDAYSLVLLQKMEGEDQSQPGVPVKVFGDVLVRRTTGAPEMVIEIQGNDDSVRINQQWDSRAQKLILTAPNRAQGRTQPPCLHIRATISLPKGARLDSINVEVLHLNIHLLSNLDLGVLKKAELTTIIGSVACATATRDENELVRLGQGGAPPFFRFEARSIYATASSGPISGAWPLFDYLRLDTLSGKVNVGIEPKPVLATDPRVATLVIRSTSGNVEFWEPVYQARQALLAQQDAAGNGLAPQGMTRSAVEILPPREYDIDVGTTSGDIKGAAAFTYSAKMHSTSGNIAVDMLAVLPAELGIMRGVAAEDQKQSLLQTTSTSGGTVVKVLEPFWWSAATSVYSTALEGASGRVPQPPLTTPPRPVTTSPEDPERGIVVPIVNGRPGDRFNVPSGPPAFLIPPGGTVPSISKRAPQVQPAESEAPEDPERGIVVPIVNGEPGDRFNVPSGHPSIFVPPGVAPPIITPRGPQVQPAESEAPEDPERGIVVPIVNGRPGDRFNVPSGHPSIFVPPGVAPPIITPRGPQLQTAEDAAAQQQQAQAAAMGVPKFLRTLQSRHSTTSAAVSVRYPSSWRGDIDATDMSGRIKVWGKDVVILDKTSNRPGVNKHVAARKGDQEGGDASSMVVQSMSGKIDIGVGKRR